MPDSSAGSSGDVCDVDRLRSLADTGLSDTPDTALDDIADWARHALGVPLAVVSLVQAERQVLPGLSAQPGTPSFPRSAPLAFSVCRHVVEAAEPLVITDSREHPLTDGHPATGMGVVAYAGFPLRDRDGHVLGALAAIDHDPRAWSDSELTTLRRITAACQADLQLRLSQRDATQEGRRRDRIENAQRLAVDRAQMLLTASQTFTDTETIDEVREQIDHLLLDEMHPTYIAVTALDRHGHAQRLGPDHSTDRGPAAERSGLIDAVQADLDAGHHGVRHLPDPTAIDQHHDQAARAHIHDLGLRCLVTAPLPSRTGPIGVIVLGWDTADAVSPTDLLAIATIAGYAAQALARAQRLDHRVTVARDLQNAMLTSLPTLPELPMAARYAPADHREYVGGDWYDAYPLTDPHHPEDQVLALSVGDIVGHSLTAVTIMGQTRSMLRQAQFDNPAAGPAAVLEAFETAAAGLELAATGTMILARLHRTPDGHHALTWTNAGHPPPLLLLPDRTTQILDEHDPLFGYRLTTPGTRADHHRELPSGSTLFLHTDGLIERRDSDIDHGTALLLRHLDGVRDQTVEHMVHSAVDTLAPNADDDVVAFAIRIP